jgi:DNA-directed RNA polymerase specialized sigma24 family protein
MSCAHSQKGSLPAKKWVQTAQSHLCCIKVQKASSLTEKGTDHHGEKPMKDLILSGLGAYDSDPDEEFLVEYDAYIRAQVWKAIQRGLFTTVAFDLEVDELVQTIRIKLWDARRKRTINHPRAYIRKIAYTTAIDMVRRYRSNTSLPTDIDEDLCLGDLLVAQNEGYQDPAYEIELREIDSYFIEKLMQGILSLPPRQRQALLYSIREHWEESLPLIKAFKAQGLDIEILDLSDEECEVHLLKASLSVARKKLQRLC